MESPRLNVLHVLIIILVVVVGAALVVPILSSSRGGSPKTQCVSNMKQVSTAMMIYLADYDERFPPRTWHTELMPYTKIEELFSCPLVKPAASGSKAPRWGYAMDYVLMGLDSTRLSKPEITPLLFEIDALAPDVVANVGARSLQRHKGGSTVSRADTSTKFYKAGVVIEDLPEPLLKAEARVPSGPTGRE